MNALNYETHQHGPHYVCGHFVSSPKIARGTYHPPFDGCGENDSNSCQELQAKRLAAYLEGGCCRDDEARRGLGNRVPLLTLDRGPARGFDAELGVDLGTKRLRLSFDCGRDADGSNGSGAGYPRVRAEAPGCRDADRRCPGLLRRGDDGDRDGRGVREGMASPVRDNHEDRGEVPPGAGLRRGSLPRRDEDIDTVSSVCKVRALRAPVKPRAEGPPEGIHN